MLKLGIDGSRKPNIVEKTDGLNFYPGLLIFEHLSAGAAWRSPEHLAARDELQPAV